MSMVCMSILSVSRLSFPMLSSSTSCMSTLAVSRLPMSHVCVCAILPRAPTWTENTCAPGVSPCRLVALRRRSRRHRGSSASLKRENRFRITELYRCPAIPSQALVSPAPVRKADGAHSLSLCSGRSLAVAWTGPARISSCA